MPRSRRAHEFNKRFYFVDREKLGTLANDESADRFGFIWSACDGGSGKQLGPVEHPERAQGRTEFILIEFAGQIKLIFHDLSFHRHDSASAPIKRHSKESVLPLPYPSRIGSAGRTTMVYRFEHSRRSQALADTRAPNACAHRSKILSRDTR